MTTSKIVLVTADFYGEYELYQTSDPDDLETWVNDMVNGRFREIDSNKHKLIGDYNTMDTDKAIKMADTTIWCNDLVEE